MADQLTGDNIQDLLKSLVEGYQDSFNSVNEKWEIQFTTTLTHHKVAAELLPADVDADLLPNKTNVDVAYLRLTKRMRPKGGDESTWEEFLVYHQSYRFRDVKERLQGQWKTHMYLQLLFQLTSAGLEYSELLRRVKPERPKEKVGLVKPEETQVEITDQMPVPLTEQELEYKEWLEKHHDKAKG